jgi:inner membrane protein
MVQRCAVDPIAHTFTGGALAAAGLRRSTPLATAALLLGANAPDVDVFAYFAGEFEALAFRRGVTHGVLALAVWPFLLTALLLLWDRFAPWRRRPNVERARAGPLLAVSALAVATHPTLDWLNNYGLRWLMPFDGRWFYGDALFIVDPWLWLGLGGVLFLMYSRRRLPLLGWAVFWLATSFFVLASGELMPRPAKIVWFAGIAALLAARAFGFAAPQREGAVERAARVALVVAALYIAALTLAGIPARAGVRADLAARGIAARDVMVAPAPANPFARDVIATTDDFYYIGRWNWLAEPRFELGDDRIPRLPRNAVVEAAASTPEARNFLAWSRFPYVEVESSAAGERTVRFLDARYRSAERLAGPRVLLDRDLRPLAAE